MLMPSRGNRSSPPSLDRVEERHRGERALPAASLLLLPVRRVGREPVGVRLELLAGR
jgi:hypothetical protein